MPLRNESLNDRINDLSSFILNHFYSNETDRSTATDLKNKFLEIKGKADDDTEVLKIELELKQIKKTLENREIGMASEKKEISVYGSKLNDIEDKLLISIDIEKRNQYFTSYI